MQKFVQLDSWTWNKYLIDVKFARGAVLGVLRNQWRTQSDSNWAENIPTLLSNENEAMRLCVSCHHELCLWP